MNTTGASFRMLADTTFLPMRRCNNAKGAGKPSFHTRISPSRTHQSGSDADAAALQVAIWEAVSDGTPDLMAGEFRLIGSPDIATGAQGYLNALFSGPGGYHTSTALWLDARDGQDQMMPTPEPGSLLLCVSGLLVFARRIKRKFMTADSGD